MRRGIRGSNPSSSTYRRGLARLSLLGAAALVALLGVAPAGARLSAPVPLAPAIGATTDDVPAFAWKPVRGADQYEFQLAADAGFNSPVLGRGQDQFLTKNTRATVKKTFPNGTYWWRVRAITIDGHASPWSQGRSLKKRWATTTDLTAPTDGATVVYPATPLKLSWTPVLGARKYLVSIAYDRALGSLVPGTGSTSGPVETTATTFTRPSALAPGTYYWGVTPVDAEGNRGVPSAVRSFNWVWPSPTTPRLTDLNGAPEVFDPEFSWDLVPGAARYEVEVNSTAGFAPGSKVCCAGNTIATALSPTTLFKDNVYYWRVRAIDPEGNAGVWNVGAPFTKTFDKTAPAGPVTGTSIKNLHMRNNESADPVTADADHNLVDGFQATAPVITWDPVPGASSYEVQVADWSGVACSWATAKYVKRTSLTSWTPLGTTTSNPIVRPGLATDPSVIDPGTYCVRVSARSDRVGFDDVLGDPTYLQNGNTDSSAPVGPAFTWTAYPSSGSGTWSAGCSGGYLCAADYREPAVGTTVGRTPLFTWTPVAGANSYFVVVAKDANFSNIVDEAFTRIPAYAPRNTSRPTTYSDETTSYYWAVLPSTAADGSTALPLSAAFDSRANFQKQSAPPGLVAPAAGTVFLGQPTFRWSPTEGARRYRLQVAQDPSFGDPIDDVITDSTAYTSDTTYPADTVLYWRVRADDENLIGLTWSSTGTFQKRLATPQIGPDNPAGGDFLPTWSWGPVPGAVAYDVAADLPDGTHRNLNGLRTAALTPILMYGTGIFSWRVRAQFPKSGFGTVPGPYSPTRTFARTIGEPAGARADVAIDRVLLSWNAKPGVRGYLVQLSTRPTFLQLLENVSTDNTSYAPPLRWFARSDLDTGRIYWRVAAFDEGNNVGDFTQPKLIARTRRMQIVLDGSLRTGARKMLTIRVRNFESLVGIAGAKVRISGAGIRPRRFRTSFGGIIRLRLRARNSGVLVIRASARGYQPTRATQRVR